jgi:hypothetical protein
VLDELEKMPGGLGDERCRERIYQVTRAINYCHSNHVSGTLSLGGRFQVDLRRSHLLSW